MNRYGHSLAGAILATFIGASALTVDAAGPADGPAIYRTLASEGLLEDYLTPEVSEILGTLVEASGRWDAYGVNQPYRPGAVNVYLVDAKRASESNPLAEFDISLGSRAQAHEPTGILLVDTDFLKSLVAVAMLAAETELDTVAAVGVVRARGVDAFRTLWDPALNPGLRNSEYTDHWVLMASGATAFALAHEMGHLYIGARDTSKLRVPIRLSDTDAANSMACDALVQEGQRQQREIEREADDFAVDVLSRVLFPEGVLNRPMLRYETGAEWYMVYAMANQLVDVARHTKSDFVRGMLRAKFGPEVYAVLSQGESDPERNAVSVFFPEEHPAAIRRAAESLSRLTESPYSVGRITGSSTVDQVALLEQLIQAECSAIDQRGRAP